MQKLEKEQTFCNPEGIITKLANYTAPSTEESLIVPFIEPVSVFYGRYERNVHNANCMIQNIHVVSDHPFCLERCCNQLFTEMFWSIKYA